MLSHLVNDLSNIQ